MTDWRDVFCGRKAELRQLIDAYESVASGAGPRLAVVCADRGMGKTRLVQELYRHLSTACDPDDYWPDASLFKGNNLRVAPDFNDPETQAHFASFTTAQRPMPFLWWGFRLNDPLDRNAVRSDMAGHRRTLDPHLERARFASEQSGKRSAIKHSAKGTAKDAALKIGEALLESVPGVGLSKNLIEVGLGIFNTARAHRDVRREDEEFGRADLSTLDARRADDLYERTLDDLAALLEPADRLGRVPAVVFCDDAQFAREGGDEGALRFLQRLWERADRGGWPLLLVATHWAVDWTQDPVEPGASFAKTFAPLGQARSSVAVVQLSKPAELAHLVTGALPGLSGADTGLLVDKADGNPQVLIELVGRVKASPAWRTPQGALSAHGRKQIAAHSCNLTTLITERLMSDATPPEVRVALALASIQGMQFLADLTQAAAHRLQLDTDAGVGLVSAENPLRLIVGVQDGVASFVQRAYREAAATLVASQLGDPQQIRLGVLDAALQLIEPGDCWERMALERRKSLLGMVASLGAESDDAAMRLQAARALIRLLLIDDDVASRARHAGVLLQGMGARWSVAAFEPFEIDAVAEALDGWDGMHGSLRLGERCVRDLRPLAAADPAAHGARLVHALLRLAEHRGLDSLHQEASALVDEAIDFQRRLTGHAPCDGTGALADVLHRACTVWGQREHRADAVKRLEAEELALRRARFQASCNVGTCKALMRALHGQAQHLHALGHASADDAAEAAKLRNEALIAARSFAASVPDAGEGQAAIVDALVACLAPIVSEGPIEFRLPSAEEAASALPLIEELLSIDGSALATDVDGAYVKLALSVFGAAAANRCGDLPARQRLLELSHDVGEVRIEKLSESNRSALCYVYAIRDLLEQDFDGALAFAQQAVRLAAEARNWQELEAASAFAHRVREQHLLVLVEPDPSDHDRAAVLPAVLHEVCASAAAWGDDPTAAGDAFKAIAWLMREAWERDEPQGHGADLLVRDVRQAVEVYRSGHDRATRPAEVTQAWLLALARTLILATRGTVGDDFEFLWQRLLGVFATAMQAERSIDDLNELYFALNDLETALFEPHVDLAATLESAILHLIESIAERAHDQWSRRQLAFRLAMSAFTCMHDDDLDPATRLLDRARELCAGLLAESPCADNLDEMRRHLEAREALARRRGDVEAERVAQLERLAVLRSLTLVDHNPERAQELDELSARLAPEMAGSYALH